VVVLGGRRGIVAASLGLGSPHPGTHQASTFEEPLDFEQCQPQAIDRGLDGPFTVNGCEISRCDCREDLERVPDVAGRAFPPVGRPAPLRSCASVEIDGDSPTSAIANAALVPQASVGKVTV
jgi:hypothetical protein